jgi:hypothetical protein
VGDGLAPASPADSAAAAQPARTKSLFIMHLFVLFPGGLQNR